ncbi:MAG: hypothetical protein NC921_00210 [Candidatus Omnitrophica bacterium]|nr:hypothetical protein [Candidatus Omnitrophota bacterium]
MGKATSLPFCHFKRNYEEGPYMLLPELSKLRQLIRLIRTKVYILAEEKNIRKH